MKKGLIALAVLLVLLVAGYIGTRWYLLGQVEPVLQAQVARSNEMTAQAGVTLELASFERGVMSATAVMRLVIDDADSLPVPIGQIEMVSDIVPGPWLSTDAGLETGLAKVSSRFNLDSLNPELAGAINELFAGQDPLTDVTVIGFDDQVRSVTRMAPIKLASNEGSLDFAGFTATGYMNARTFKGEAWVEGGALSVKTPQGEGGWPGISAYMRIDDMVAGQVVGEQTLSIDNVQVNSILLGAEPITFDVAMNVDTDVEGDLGSSRLGFWVKNLKAAAVPADGFYYGLDLDNLSVAGYEKMLDEMARIDALQQQLLAIGDAPQSEEDMVRLMQLQSQIQALSMQLMDVFVQDIMVADKSHFRLRFMANKGEAVLLNSDMTLDFRGLPANASSAMELMMMPPQQASAVFDSHIAVAAIAETLPPPATASLDVLVDHLLVVRDEQAYRFELKIEGGAPALNGEAITFETLLGRFAAAKQVLSPVAPDPAQDMGEAGELAPMESLEYPGQ